MYLFMFLTLYMFPAHRAHHQERQIVSIQPLVAVTLCRSTKYVLDKTCSWYLNLVWFWPCIVV